MSTMLALVLAYNPQLSTAQASSSPWPPSSVSCLSNQTPEISRRDHPTQATEETSSATLEPHLGLLAAQIATSPIVALPSTRSPSSG